MYDFYSTIFIDRLFLANTSKAACSPMHRRFRHMWMKAQTPRTIFCTSAGTPKSWTVMRSASWFVTVDIVKDFSTKYVGKGTHQPRVHGSPSKTFRYTSWRNINITSSAQISRTLSDFTQKLMRTLPAINKALRNWKQHRSCFEIGMQGHPYHWVYQ